MELPNYFLADLSDPSTLTQKLISEACETLKQNRERFLLPRSTDSIIHLLATLGRDWRDRDYPFRKMVLDQGPERTGFTRETLTIGLNQFFAQVTRENLEALVLQDFGSLRRMDELCSSEIEIKSNRASITRGPDLIAHFTGGALPNPTLSSMITGLLCRSAQFFKCATGTSFIPRMFAHSLYIVEPKLGSCLEVAEWKGGTENLDAALLAQASCVTATGTDQTVESLRTRVPHGARFLSYGHKLSFSFVAREMLSQIERDPVVKAAADDITAWDQLGCLSPHIIYVETGGSDSPHKFAEDLATELGEREKIEPRGSVEQGVAAAITARRMLYDARASDGEHTRIWQSAGSTAWTVVYEEDPQWQLSCLNRFVYVKPVATLPALLHALAPVQPHLSTIGLAAPASRARDIALEFSRFGASRICRIGQMQNPPLTWRHDGRPSLGDLVSWSDFEF